MYGASLPQGRSYPPFVGWNLALTRMVQHPLHPAIPRPWRVLQANPSDNSSPDTALAVDINPDFRTRLQESQREGQWRSFRRIPTGPYRLSVQASGEHHCEPRRIVPVDDYEREEVSVFPADGAWVTPRTHPEVFMDKVWSQFPMPGDTGERATASTYPARTGSPLRFPGARIRRLLRGELQGTLSQRTPRQRHSRDEVGPGARGWRAGPPT